MINARLTDRQRQLFETEMGWEQLPSDIRRQVVALLATVCIELIDETQPSARKEHHGPTEDYQGVAGVAVLRKEEYPLETLGKNGPPKRRVATGGAQHYLLSLKARKDGKFNPVSRQIDSKFSVIELEPQLAPPNE
jgi:hypothetical protein